MLVGLGSIDLDVIGSPIQDFAFVAPRAGTITSLAGFFSVTAGVTIPLLSTAFIQMQLYRSTLAAGNVFTPVGTPLLLSPGFTSLTIIGAVANGIIPQTISVAAQDKILLVVSINTVGIDLVTAFTGFASAGITFE
ncbi:hypothetical protein BWGOE3_23480 [Bacillus mycoides]|nr:hypothetical protein BWGOE2_23500 [Bacillus mycoides]OFD49322.1 hypothetical protein BWGOE3_23480 [Bacillus mycoides]OFD60165.1 hypothetical protein BWGOE6_24280 [Bacillus mycoides]OFE01248.1 hypothetical protein BWGOE13_24870 [Bacillus mycoides]